MPITRKTTSNVGSTSSTGRLARHVRRHAGAAPLAGPIAMVCLVTGANHGAAEPPPLAQPASPRSIGIELRYLGRLFLQLLDELVERLLTADVILRFAHHVPVPLREPHRLRDLPRCSSFLLLVGNLQVL